MKAQELRRRNAWKNDCGTVSRLEKPECKGESEIGASSVSFS